MTKKQNRLIKSEFFRQLAIDFNNLIDFCNDAKQLPCLFNPPNSATFKSTLSTTKKRERETKKKCQKQARSHFSFRLVFM